MSGAGAAGTAAEALGHAPTGSSREGLQRAPAAERGRSEIAIFRDRLRAKYPDGAG